MEYLNQLSMSVSNKKGMLNGKELYWRIRN